ncbi:sigma-70 family RNA polymerase sigma factor [Paludibacterium yongneupense]|uniref:sigma-70 family RNA polymerase sigma factor n=1 Tax=Paludibacterium yongneupense TaxID=400061 RepID=UPI0003FD9B46|nr:sigma-70 family RNA polymerase sigma factor [Paludibacterium yongneupense]
MPLTHGWNAGDVEDVRRDMVRFALLQLRDEAMAEDAVQEALLAAMTAERSFAGRAALKTWIFGILKHKIADLLRQQRRTVSVAPHDEDESLDDAFDALFKANAHWSPESRPRDWGDPEGSLQQSQFWRIFDICLTGLPENTARVFMMREFLELGTKEICASQGLSSSHCHVILYRARMALRLCLENRWFDGERQ